ncbi:hypothetical protein DL767_006913 [Monosporascus sp. MG133]|nr:hypothetical protein DL767_006913 [Monosporascus sp. MG133]
MAESRPTSTDTLWMLDFFWATWARSLQPNAKPPVSFQSRDAEHVHQHQHQHDTGLDLPEEYMHDTGQAQNGLIVSSRLPWAGGASQRETSPLTAMMVPNMEIGGMSSKLCSGLSPYMGSKRHNRTVLQDTDDEEVDDLIGNDEFGVYLVTLYSTLENTKWDKRPILQADIVLVAGLGGHPLKTWQADDENQTLWPRDLLPEHIPNIRVLSFNYNTTLKGSASDAGIREHAEDLLATLLDKREDDGDDAKLRPIVFVGHSLGGLIIKRALFLAQRKLGGRYKWLWEASRGVMFFSTPHLGMDKAQWRSFVRYVLQYDAEVEEAVPTQGMLVEIWNSASALVNISEDFEPLHPYLAFHTFVETRPMQGLGEPFVSMVHGRLRAPTEHHETIAGDHLGLCKFEREDTISFLPVWNGINDLILQTPKAIDRIGRHGKKALYALCTDEFHSQPLGKKPTSGTCDWVSEQREIKGWLSSDLNKQKLWICGPPACGKSYLARHIISQLGEITPNDVIYCFITTTIPSHGDLQAILRSTLHQALRLEPEVINKIFHPEPQPEERNAGEAVVERNFWTNEKLKCLWPEIMAEVTARRPIIAVIYGLDELGKDDREEFFNCLGRFEEKITSPQNWKLLLVSCEDIKTEAAEHGFERFDAKPAEITGDLIKSIQEGLDRVWTTRRLPNIDRNVQDEICEKIKERSDGVYLSASLIADDLSRDRDVRSEADIMKRLNDLSRDRDVRSEADIMKRLNDSKFPTNLIRVYKYVLDRMSRTREIADLVDQALLWAAFQKEALKPAEFNIAQAVGRALKKYRDGPITDKELEEFLDDNIAMTLEFHCGHLVKFQDGRLELVHGSLRRYLIAQRSGSGGPNATLAGVCVTYLTMSHFEEPGDGPDPERMYLWESKVHRRVNRHKFVRYTSLHWHDHISEAGGCWPGEHEQSTMTKQSMMTRRALLENDNTGYARSWTEVWWYFTMWPDQNFPRDALVEQVTAPPSSEPEQEVLATSKETARPFEKLDTPPTTLAKKDDEEDESISTSEHQAPEASIENTQSVLPESQPYTSPLTELTQTPQVSVKKEQLTGELKHQLDTQQESQASKTDDVSQENVMGFGNLISSNPSINIASGEIAEGPGGLSAAAMLVSPAIPSSAEPRTKGKCLPKDEPISRNQPVQTVSPPADTAVEPTVVDEPPKDGPPKKKKIPMGWRARVKGAVRILTQGE